MLAKVLLVCLLVAVISAKPAPEVVGDEEDLPVYTEKVVPSQPTKAPKSTGDASVEPRRYAPKKLRSAPKKATAKHRFIPAEDRLPYRAPKDTPSSARPLKKAQRDIRRLTPKVQGPLRGEHAVQQPTYAALPDQLYGVVPRKPYGSDAGLRYRPVPQVQYDTDGDEAGHEYSSEPKTSAEYAPAPAPVAPAVYVPPPKAPAVYVPAPAPKDPVVYAHASAPAPIAPVVYAPPPKAPAVGYETNAYDDSPQPYSFGYELKDEYGSTLSRQEQDDGYGNKKGSYGYTDGHGIYRHVEYIADKDGFRATIKTNEPGTDNENPADVVIHSEAGKQEVGHY